MIFNFFKKDKRSKLKKELDEIGAKIYVVINLLYLPFQIVQFIRS